MLSLSLPLGRSEAAQSEGFAPNAFIRIGSDGQVVLIDALCRRWGRGTLHLDPDADR